MPAVGRHARYLPDRDRGAVRPPRHRLRLDSLVGGEHAGLGIDHARHRVPVEEAAPLGASRARARQPAVDAGRPDRLDAREAVHDPAGPVGVQHVVAAGRHIRGVVERAEPVAGVPAREPAERPAPDASLRAPLRDRDAVLQVPCDDRPVERVVERHVLGAGRRHLLADRRSALGYVEGLRPLGHLTRAAAVEVPLRIAWVDPLDVVVDLLADVARYEGPGVVVAPADPRPRAEPGDGEAGAVPAGRVLSELPEDRGRAETSLGRPEHDASAATRPPAADRRTVRSDLRERQSLDDRPQRGGLRVARARDRRERRRVGPRQALLARARQPLGEDRPRRPVARPAADRGRARVVLEEQLVPDREAALVAEPLLQATEQRGVPELPGAALAGELDVREEHRDAHRVGRLPRLGRVSEHVEEHRAAGRVEHDFAHPLVEAVAEGLELALDVRGQHVVLPLDVGRVVEVAAHHLVGGQHVLALELRDPALREQADAVRDERALLRKLVAGAVRERVGRPRFDVRHAVGVVVDGDGARAQPRGARRSRRHSDERHQRRGRRRHSRTPTPHDIGFIRARASLARQPGRSAP